MYQAGMIITDGILTVRNGTASTSATTGALIVSGGVGIGGDLNIAGKLNTGNKPFTFDGWVGAPGYDANTIGRNKSGFTYANNAPYAGPLVHFGVTGDSQENYGLQFNALYNGAGNALCFRTRNGDMAAWNGWQRVLTSTYDGNFYTSGYINIGGAFAPVGGVASVNMGTGVTSGTTNLPALLYNQMGWIRYYGTTGSGVTLVFACPTGGNYRAISVSGMTNTTQIGRLNTSNNAAYDGNICVVTGTAISFHVEICYYRVS